MRTLAAERYARALIQQTSLFMMSWKSPIPGCLGAYLSRCGEPIIAFALRTSEALRVMRLEYPLLFHGLCQCR